MRQMIMKVSTAGAAVLSCVALAGAALAWQAATSPNQSVLTEIANAQPGATIIVPSTFDGQLVITGKHFSSPITIRNNSTLVQAIVVRDSSNIIIEGGAVIGGTGVIYAVHIDRAKSVTVRGMTLTNTVRGMVINQSEAIGVYQNRMTGLRTDGVNIAASRNVVVEGNSCSNFNPIPAIYDSAGNLVKDGDHPDCIQSWSVSSFPPNSDLVIRGNTINGDMQGIFLGNKVRDGVNDGGYDRVVIENNFVNVSQPNGIMIEGGRGVRMAYNEVQTIDGSRLLNGAGSLVKAGLKAFTSTDVVACSNIVEAVPTGFGTAPCPGQTAPVASTTTAPVAPAPEPVVTTIVALAPIAPAPEPAPAPAPVPSAPTVPEPVAIAPVAAAPTVAAPTTTEPVLAVVQAVITEPTIVTTVPKTPRGRKVGRGNLDAGDSLVTTSAMTTSSTTTARAAVAPATPSPTVKRTVVAAPVISAPIVAAPANNATATQPVLAVVQAIVAPSSAPARGPATLRRQSSGRGSAGAE